ncbi:MAG: hypothetical protein KDA21_03640, partial [Phycisphaerales bacterium]|nr:hypothetical protein [Phycisphaerales bacterium]
IEPGYDADIAIIDPRRTVKVDWKKLQSRCDWNPWQGQELGGFAHTTLCRGETLVKAHRFVGPRGHGKLIARTLPRD